LRPSGIHRIFLYDQCVDMRKSFEGLSRLIEASYPGNLLTGALFLFLNRRRNLIKILYWDGDGFVIWYKRLEQGTFSGCFSGQDELSRQQFTMLLEGVVPRRLNKRFSLSN
jgi:transposase